MSDLLRRRPTASPEESVEGCANELQDALRHGGADGLVGTDFFGDETWNDDPPQPQKVADVAMKAAGLQKQTREEQ